MVVSFLVVLELLHLRIAVAKGPDAVPDCRDPDAVPDPIYVRRSACPPGRCRSLGVRITTAS
eukprot:COSAG01_NODE_2648_length_7319_cov_7.831093_3_plen_62_part_00